MSLVCRMCKAAALRPLGPVRGYPFVECRQCGFVFTPAVTDETMAALYAAGYHGPGDGGPEVGWMSTAFLEPALDLLPRPRPLTILDFGCGQSLLPELLRGWGHRVIAIDLAPPLRPHPDRLTGPLAACDLPERSFDLAFAFQVFEHLPEPRPILDTLLRLTRPGGLVLIHTDMEGPERTQTLAEWWYVTPPDHCSFFRQRTFEHCLAPTPHRIVWRDPKSVIIRIGPTG